MNAQSLYKSQLKCIFIFKAFEDEVADFIKNISPKLNVDKSELEKWFSDEGKNAFYDGLYEYYDNTIANQTIASKKDFPVGLTPSGFTYPCICSGFNNLIKALGEKYLANISNKYIVSNNNSLWLDESEEKKPSLLKKDADQLVINIKNKKKMFIAIRTATLNELHVRLIKNELNDNNFVERLKDIFNEAQQDLINTVQLLADLGSVNENKLNA